MTVSASNRSIKQLWSDLLVALGGEEGFLTRDLSERQVLIELLNTFGGSYTKRTIGGRENILAAIVVAAGGTASPRHSQPELLASLVAALGGDPVDPLSSSMSQLLAAAVNSAGGGGGGDLPDLPDGFSFVVNDDNYVLNGTDYVITETP